MPLYRQERNGVARIAMGSTDGADEAYRLIETADATLPDQVRTSWRWRILYLRALIGSELAGNDSKVTDRCAEALKELERIYRGE